METRNACTARSPKIAVTEVNRDPTLESIADQTVPPGDLLTALPRRVVEHHLAAGLIPGEIVGGVGLRVDVVDTDGR
jgi:hypothetical protein